MHEAFYFAWLYDSGMEYRLTLIGVCVNTSLSLCLCNNMVTSDHSHSCLSCRIGCLLNDICLHKCIVLSWL